jgi:hypothetical protein
MTETMAIPSPAEPKSVKQPPLLFDRTQALIARIEKQIACKLLV